MKLTRLIIIGIFATIFSLALVQVVVANSLSTTGIELAQLQTQIQKYKKENSLLKEKVLKVGSLTKIASDAAELGFIPLNKTVSITSPLPLAKR